MLLEKNPDLTIKNKKKKTAIEITNNKKVISLLSQFLPKNEDKILAGKIQEIGKCKNSSSDKSRHRSYQFVKAQEEDKELNNSLPYGVCNLISIRVKLKVQRKQMQQKKVALNPILIAGYSLKRSYSIPLSQ